MKESVRKMRETERVYSSARQVRCDELMAESGGLDPTSDAMFDKHKKVVKRMDLELHATEVDSIDDPLMCTTMALIDRNGGLYLGDKTPYDG